MCQLVLVLLTVVAGYAGAATIERCCSQKMVGGVNYTLVDDKKSTKQWGCHSDCIFERVDTKGSRVCFKSGDLEVVCPEDFLCDNCVEAPENVCDTCFEFCSPDPNNTACLDCVKTECPICLRPCGFPPIDANATEEIRGVCQCHEVEEYNFCVTKTSNCKNFGENFYAVCLSSPPKCGPCRCELFDGDVVVNNIPCPIFNNTKFMGTPTGIVNAVNSFTACQIQCKNNPTICKFWSWDSNGIVGNKLCSMFEADKGRDFPAGWISGSIVTGCTTG